MVVKTGKEMDEDISEQVKAGNIQGTNQEISTLNT